MVNDAVKLFQRKVLAMIYDGLAARKGLRSLIWSFSREEHRVIVPAKARHNDSSRQWITYDGVRQVRVHSTENGDVGYLLIASRRL